MAVIKLTGFTGERPRIAPRLLPDSSAQIAQSVRLEDGSLTPFRQPFLVENLAGAVAGTVKTIYRFGSDWLYWTSIVHAAPGPVATDRLYYTGDGVPKMRVGSTIYDLEVPAPTAALTGTPAGVGSGQAHTRLYVYTFVTAFGEESEPCPISNEVTWQFGQTVTLSGFQNAPAGRNITLQRIYRSQTGTSGGTQLFFIAERAASNGNYIDSIAADAYGEPLPSLEYNPPPDDLHNIVAMPNGMMAGLSGKDLCFSEPWQPHAWPEKYRLTLDYEGVALGVNGTTLVVGTKGHLYFAGGTHPDSVVLEKSELNMPCLNAAGMIDLGFAVAYPSHDGLVVVQGGSASVVTADLLTRDQWLRMNPDTMICGQFYGRYFAAYSYTDTAGETQEGTLILDLAGQASFIIRSQYMPEAMFFEQGTGALFMCFGPQVYEWDSVEGINDTFTWKSKAFVLPAPTNFGAVLFEVDLRDDQDAVLAYEAALAAAIAANAALFAGPTIEGEVNGSALNMFALNGDAIEPLPTGPSARVNIYADGDLYASVTQAGRMQRIKSGKLARQWEIEVVGNIGVIEFTMAGTAQELRSI